MGRKKTHLIADVLSCAPVFQPEEEEDDTIDTAIRCLQIRESNELASIADAIDKKYNLIVQAVKSDTNFKLLLSHHPARQLLSICTQLSIDKLGGKDVIMQDGSRILVPREARKKSLRNSTVHTRV